MSLRFISSCVAWRHTLYFRQLCYHESRRLHRNVRPRQYSVISPVGCVRFGKGTLPIHVLQAATFGFVLMLDIHTFILWANRALATYKAHLLIKTVLYLHLYMR